MEDQQTNNSKLHSHDYILPVILIAVTVTGLSLFFTYSNPQVFPTGESYIHFVYARNLHTFGELAYNPGIVEGIGTTSLLWVLSLTAFLKIGITPLISARVLGIGLLVISGILCFDLAYQLLPRLETRRRRQITALWVALICVSSGNFLWIALSGMETILFTALGLLTLYAYHRERWWLAGFSLGCLTLTRMEGVVLGMVIVAAEILRNRRISNQILGMVISAALLILPWILVLEVREGAPIPTSFQGKMLTTTEVVDIMIENNPGIAWILTNPPIAYLTAWTGYLLLYMFGGISLPGPAIHSPGIWRGHELSLPVAGILVILALMIPLLVKYGRSFWRHKHLITLSNSRHRLALVTIGWFLLHNMAYAIFLPQPGSAGRYAPMNHLLFWAGALSLSLLLPNRWFRAATISMVSILLVTSLQYWYHVYQANILYMLNVRIPAAQYVDRECDPTKPVGTTDLGVLRYYARQPILDLLGFVNKDIPGILGDDRGFSDYLLEKKVECLYAFMPIDNVGLDTLERMKIYEDPRFQLRREANFSAPLDEWFLGSSAIGNYLPSVSVFRIIPYDG